MAVKTRRSMKSRTCQRCEASIAKGDQYGTKRLRMGNSTIWARDDRPVEEIPEWAWEPYYVSGTVCSSCAKK